MPIVLRFTNAPICPRFKVSEYKFYLITRKMVWVFTTVASLREAAKADSIKTFKVIQVDLFGTIVDSWTEHGE